MFLLCWQEESKKEVYYLRWTLWLSDGIYRAKDKQCDIQREEIINHKPKV